MKLIRVKEVADMLSVSVPTVYRRADRGQLPGAVKIGGSIRFHRETIEKWVLEQLERGMR